ncbi:MAG: hypothetical protein U0P81_09395 [Holophagaceae bacterium]
MLNGRWIVGLSLVALAAGCDNKGGQLPTTPPLAAQEPGALLEHLKYLVGSGDAKHLVLITPVTEDVVFPSSAWFHRNCAGLGIDLTPEEMTKLGVDPFKDRLNNLPAAPEPGYGIDQARAAFNAGLFRLIKGFSKEAWASMVVSEVKPNPANGRVTDVFIAYKGNKVMSLNCVKKSDGTWGISNLNYLVWPPEAKARPGQKK